MGWFVSGLFVCLCFGVLREVRVFAIRPEEALRGFKGRGEFIVKFRVGFCLRFSTAFQNRVCGWKVIKIATLVFFCRTHHHRKWTFQELNDHRFDFNEILCRQDRFWRGTMMALFKMADLAGDIAP